LKENNKDPAVIEQDSLDQYPVNPVDPVKKTAVAQLP
jgi:hypothetical protein